MRDDADASKRMVRVSPAAWRLLVQIKVATGAPYGWIIDRALDQYVARKSVGSEATAAPARSARA